MRLHITDFGKDRPQAHIPFGIDKHETAKTLRALARAVEEGTTLVKAVAIDQEATQEDFQRTVLSLQLHEPKEG